MITLFIHNNVLKQSLSLLFKRYEVRHEIVIADSSQDINLEETAVVIIDQEIPAIMPCPVIDLRTMPCPIKPSLLLSRVSAALNQGNNHRHIKHINLGAYIFKPHDFSLQDLKENIINLTEKERDILLYIDRNSPVSRDDLLHAVWGYGSNIETHTVETHIYRLRQKIEKDPSKPELLITTDEGYILNMV